MIVKTSGERYICIGHIETMQRDVSSTEKWRVRMVSGDSFTLTQTQMDELQSGMVELFDAEMHCNEERVRQKRRTAERTLKGQLGYIRWQSMDEDAQYDAVSDEVARQEAISEAAHG